MPSVLATGTARDGWAPGRSSLPPTSGSTWRSYVTAGMPSCTSMASRRARVPPTARWPSIPTNASDWDSVTSLVSAAAFMACCRMCGSIAGHCRLQDALLPRESSAASRTLKQTGQERPPQFDTKPSLDSDCAGETGRQRWIAFMPLGRYPERNCKGERTVPWHPFRTDKP